MEISILESLEYNANLETISDYIKDDNFRDLILFVTIGNLFFLFFSLDSQFLKESRISLAQALQEHKELEGRSQNTNQSDLVKLVSRALRKAAN